MFGARSVRAAAGPLRAVRRPAPQAWGVCAVAGTGVLAYSLGTAWSDGEAQPLAPTEQRLPLCSVFAWGSNRYAFNDSRSNKVAAPNKSKSTISTPTEMPAFAGVALRDLQLAETYGAAVDAHGDVVQWGTGFDDASSTSGGILPQRTLTGKDIVRLQLCGPKIYALSRSGAIYVFAAQRSMQGSSASWLDKLSGTSTSIDYVQLSTFANERNTSERFVAIAAGTHHLLALSRSGTVWSVPVDMHANAYGQLGYSQTALNAAPTQADAKQMHSVSRRLEPRILARKVLSSEPSELSSDLPEGMAWMDPSNIRFATQLRPIPSLQDVPMAQIAAGAEHSAARTPSGRVLAWGRNSHGQLALGESVLSDTVAVPTEVGWPRRLVGADARCTHLVAGANNTFFVLQSAGAPTAGSGEDAPPPGPTAAERIDVLASGGGQSGTLGNAQRPQMSGALTRVKNVSNMQEYSEQARALIPIGVRALSVGADGQCALVMDVHSEGEERHRDVYVWGANDEYQLGIGKRGNLAAPVLLTLPLPGDEKPTKNGPVLNRLLLVERAKVPGHAYDPERRALSSKYTVEQQIVAGGHGMAVYGRIVL